jgi:protein unc-80
VLSLGHTLLALITKAASVVPDEMFTDIMPVAWELLIETDQELAAAAGKLS